MLVSIHSYSLHSGCSGFPLTQHRDLRTVHWHCDQPSGLRHAHGQPDPSRGLDDRRLPPARGSSVRFMVSSKPLPELPLLPVPHDQLDHHFGPQVRPDRTQGVAGQAVVGHHQANPDHDRVPVFEVGHLVKIGRNKGKIFFHPNGRD